MPPAARRDPLDGRHPGETFNYTSSIWNPNGETMAVEAGMAGARRHTFGWVVLIWLAYIAIASALMLKAPDTAKAISVLGDNTFLIVGVVLIAALFVLAMQLEPEEEGEPVQQSAAPVFTEAPPPPPPKEFKPIETPAPPPPKEEAEVVEASVVQDRKVVIYPAKVDGGLYGDTLIPVDGNTVLQVRSVLADEKDLF